MPKRDTQSTASASRASGSCRKSKRRSPTQRQDPDGNAAAASEPNFDSNDPYAILGVSRDATFQQIKLSYRKLALKHHPDRQASDADKEVAHKRFASISNAYEILGDEGRRRDYDEGLRQQQRQPQRQQSRGHSSRDFFGDNIGGFGHDPFSMFNNDPFFSSPFGGRSSSSRSAFHFTDPFELFEQFFAEEMGHYSRARRSRTSGRSDPFASDPFASDPFASDPFASDPFASDPFFSSSGSLFGRDVTGLSGHVDRMHSMMSQMHGSSMLGGGFGDRQQQLMSSRGNGGGSSYNFASSSSSFSNRGGNRSVSTSTKTTIVNGVRTTVREHTVVHPDGRVDRHVETIEGGGNDTDRLASGNHPAIEYSGSRRRSRR